jgi:hypothetical protein
MKRLVINAALILGLAGGLAFAQTINSALQVSQDGRGIFGVDTNNNLYIQSNRHLLATSNVSPAPVLTSCGTSPTITGSDFSFKLVTGSAATTCTITFGQAFVTAPQCFLQANGGATQPTYTTSTTALTVTVDIASTTYSGLCMSIS